MVRKKNCCFNFLFSWLTGVPSTRKDTTLPLSKALRLEDGRVVNQIEIPEGTTIFAGIIAVNRSQAIWGPDASEWRPERWMAELPDGVKAAHLPTIYPGMFVFPFMNT